MNRVILTAILGASTATFATISMVQTARYSKLKKEYDNLSAFTKNINGEIVDVVNNGDKEIKVYVVQNQDGETISSTGNPKANVKR